MPFHADARADSIGAMNVDIDQLMQHRVMRARPHQTTGHVRALMAEQRLSALPVVNTAGEPVGIVTAVDLLVDRPDGAPISSFMSSPVYTVPRYDGPHIAARVMRNHHLHHVVVTEGNVVVGIVSAYDLLRLVEDHRFVAKRAPTPKTKKPRNHS